MRAPDAHQPQTDPVTGQPFGEQQTPIETKEFFRTSEFAVLLVVCVGLMITALADAAFTALDAWTFIALAASAYILSRGLAKAGTSHPFRGRRPMPDLRERFYAARYDRYRRPAPAYAQGSYPDGEIRSGEPYTEPLRTPAWHADPRDGDVR